jgi:hypothetical protein
LVNSVASAAGFIAALILGAAALVHVYWAAGGRLGKGAAIPVRDGSPVLRPSAFGTLAVGIALLAAACLVAVRSGLIVLPALAWLAGPAVWVLAVVFTARAIGDFRYVGFFKRVKGSRFARLDGAVFSPLCLLLGLLVAIVAAS